MQDDISHNLAYLAAKKSIDQRSLHPRVWGEVWQRCPQPPLQILELGAGIGTMIERLIEKGVLKQADYCALDLNPEVLEAAKHRIAAWADNQNLKISERDQGLSLIGRELELTLTFKTGDISESLSGEMIGKWDLLLANAVLDLVDIPTVLPNLLTALKPQGEFYFTITFDGLTAFEPAIDPQLDAQIIELYHRTMDERRYAGKPAGHSRSGRILLRELTRLGATIHAAGPSDWIVFPGENGYTNDEETLVEAILDTMENALTNQGEIGEQDLTFWLNQRRRQLKEHQLIFLAHQLDVCGRPPAPTVAQ